jgi:hypothetical protein
MSDSEAMRSIVQTVETVERVKGIEPSSRAWEAFVLPLNYTRMTTFYAGSTRSGKCLPAGPASRGDLRCHCHFVPQYDRLVVGTVERLMKCRSLANVIGNGVACIAISACNDAPDRDRLSSEPG